MSSHSIPTPPKLQLTEPQDIYLDRGPELPKSYGRDRLAAFARDPECVWAYWTLDGERMAELRGTHGGSVFDGATWVLRFHNWTRRETSEIGVDVATGGWYSTARPNCRFIVELGAHTAAGFLSVILSNEVQTPRNAPSEVEDAAWPITEEALEQMRRLLGNVDLSTPGAHAWPSGPGMGAPTWPSGAGIGAPGPSGQR